MGCSICNNAHCPPGNENVVDGITICDYCNVKYDNDKNYKYVPTGNEPIWICNFCGTTSEFLSIIDNVVVCGDCAKFTMTPEDHEELDRLWEESQRGIAEDGGIWEEAP